MGATAAQAQSQTALSGIVRDVNGHGVGGATVTVISDHGNVETHTTSSGAFQVERLRPGTYLVVAVKEGYNPGFMPHALVADGKTAAVDVLMPPDKGPSHEGPHDSRGGPPCAPPPGGMPPPPPR